MTASTMKLLQECLTFLERKAVPKVANRIKEARIIELHDNSMTVGGGTPLAITITKDPNGRVEAVSEHRGDEQIALRPPSESHQPGTFELLEDHIRRTALQESTAELTAYLKLLPRREHRADQRITADILAAKDIRDQLGKTAEAALQQHPDFQGPNTPAGRAYKLQNDFFGNDWVERTINIAGNGASVQNITLMQDHIDEFEEEARRHPNFVFVWTRIATEPPASDVAPPVLATVANAVSHFIKFTKPTGRKRNYMDFQETLRGINSQALKSMPAETSLDAVHDLIRHILRAGIQPSAEATLHLLERPHLLANTPPTLMSAFIRESIYASARRQGTEEQNRLIAQFHLIRAYAVTHYPKVKQPWDPGPIRAALQDPHPRWDLLNSLLPRQTQDAETLDDLDGLQDIVPKGRSSKPTPRELDQRLNEPYWRNISLLAASRAITIHSVPGERVALGSPHKDRPYMVVEKQPDGTIIFWDQAGNHPRAEMVGPDLEAPPAWNFSTLGIADFVRGLGPTVAYQTIADHWRHIQPAPHIKGPSPETIRATYRHTALDIISKHYSKPATQQAVETRLIEAAATLPNQEVWARTLRTLEKQQEHEPSIRHHQYNTVALMGESLNNLRKTNPGAVLLGLTFLTNKDPINHPGQFIKLTKRLLEEEGLSPRSWRFAATLDPLVMKAMLQAPATTEKVTTLLNNLSKAQAVPTPRIAAALAGRPAYTLVQEPHRDTASHEATCAHNLYILTKLAAQESQRLQTAGDGENAQRALYEEILSVTDYVTVTTRENETLIHASTWSGLRRRSEQWHFARHRHGAAWRSLKEAARIRSQRDTPPVCWDSAVGTTEIRDHTVVPLTDEDQLIQESLHMGHCVYQYAPRCAENSRIFSIQRDGNNLATAELALVQNRWEPVQAQGPDNSRVSQEIEEVTKELAELYNKAWRERRQQ